MRKTKNTGTKSNANRRQIGSKIDRGSLGQARSNSELQALEPRVLLDAAGFATAVEVADNAMVEQTSIAVDQAINGEIIAPWYATQTATDRALFDSLAGDAERDSSAHATEVAFVDSGVEGFEQIVSAFDDSVEVYILQPDRDGVEQIAAALEAHAQLDAIHIVSHGRSGTLDLGSTKLTAASMVGKHSDEMVAIGAALSAEADILIYGCNFAGGARGEGAVAALAAATGADVAASNDLTGALDLGGDWDLEIQTGGIDAKGLDAVGFSHVLASPIIDLNVADNSTTDTSVVFDSSTAGPVFLANSDATGSDADNDVVRLTLALSDFNSNAAEAIIIDPNGINSVIAIQDASFNSAFFFNGTNYSTAVSLSGGDGAIVIERSDSGTISTADLEALIRVIAYDSNAALSADRTVGFTLYDGTSVSNIATTTITTGLSIPDTDGDGITDDIDVDDDNDGILDELEQLSSTDAQTLFEEGNGTLVFFESFENAPHVNDATVGSELGNVDINFSSGDNVPPGWTKTGGSGVVIVTRDATGDSTVAATDGVQALWLNEEGAEVTSDQQFSLVSGNRYLLSLDVFSDNVNAATAVEVRFGGQTQTLSISTAQGRDGVAQQVIFDFVAPADLTTQIVLREAGRTTASPVIDNIQLVEFTPPFNTRDTDNDGIANHLDIDSDNDGITDNLEAQTTVGYIAPGREISNVSAVISSGDNGRQLFFDHNLLGSDGHLQSQLQANFVSDFITSVPNDGVNIGSTTVRDLVYGPGLRVASAGDADAVTGLAAPDLASAMANDAFVELNFTATTSNGDHAIASISTFGGVANYVGQVAVELNGRILDTVSLNSNASSGFVVVPLDLSSASVLQDGENTVRWYFFGSATDTALLDSYNLNFARSDLGGGLDLNGDGLNDVYDNRDVMPDDDPATVAEALLDPVDTDNDGDADFIDTDSDNEGANDTIEAGLTGTATGLASLATDADNDGLFDVFDTQNNTTADDGFDVNESISAGAAALRDIDDDAAGGVPLSEDVDFRDASVDQIDTDGDGITDDIDVDDDNDGILDTVEGASFAVVDVENFDTPAVPQSSNFNNFAQAYPNGASQLENFRGTAGYFTGTNPTVQGVTFLDAHSGEGYAGLHGNNNNNFAEAVILSLDADRQLVAGATYELSFYAYQMNLAPFISTDFNDPGFFDIYGVEAGVDIGPSTSTGTSPALLAAIPGVTLLGSSELIDNTTAWEEYTIGLTASATYDRIILSPRSVTGARNSSPFLAFDTLTYESTSSADFSTDGIPNHLDIDSDNDGIPDNIEAQTTADYIAPSGIGAGITDINNDGLDDNYDSRNANGTNTLTAGSAAATVGDGDGLTPVNTDGVDNVDYLDLDSDNEGGNDTAEAGLTGTATGLSTPANDADGDGLFNVFDAQNGTAADDGFVVNESIVTGASALPDIDGDASGGVPLTQDVDFRDAQDDRVDTDGDGVIDFVDVDDDNDGILDVDEGLSIITDGDQYVDYVIRFDQVGPTGPFDDPNDTLGAPDGEYTSLGGTGSELVVGYLGAVLTNNGDGNPDLALTEFGAIEETEVSLRPTEATRILLDAQGVLTPDLEGFYSFGIITGSAPVDIDAITLNAFAAGELEFDAIKFTGNNDAGGANPGPDIDGVEALSVRVFRQEITRDTDNDGIADHLDIDSDNDGITDNIEAQTTAGYIAPNANDAVTYASNDGLNSAYVGTNGLQAVDTDADGDADVVDTDSDNEGGNDTAEAGLTGTATGLSTPANDADGDGLFDVFETQGGTTADDGFNVNESLNTGAASFPDADSDAAGGVPLSEDVDFRDATTPPVLDLNSTAALTDADRGFSASYTAGTSAVAIADLDADALEATGVNGFTSLTITPSSALPDGASEILTIAGQAFPLNVDGVARNVTIPGTTTQVDISYRDGVLTAREVNNGVIDNAAMDALIRSVTYQNDAANPNDSAARTFDFQVAQFDPSTFIIDFEEFTAGERVTSAQIESSAYWGSEGVTNTGQDTLNGYVAANAVRTGALSSPLSLAANADGNFLFHNTFGVVPTDENVVFGRSDIPVDPNTEYTISLDLGRVNAVAAGPFQIVVDDVVIGTVSNTPTNNFQTYTFSFSSGSTSSVDFEIRNLSTNPTGNDFGIDNISFQREPLILSNVATATVDIIANTPPVATPDSAVAQPGGDAVTIDVTSNDTDAEMDDLSVTAIVDPSDPANPIPITAGESVTLADQTFVTLNSDGTLDVSVAAGAQEDVTLQYVVSDSKGGLDVGDITVEIDSDGDGVANIDDVDDDNDGILDVDEDLETTFTALNSSLGNFNGVSIFDATPTTSRSGAAFSDFDLGETFPGGPVMVSSPGNAGDTRSFTVDFPDGIEGEVFLAALNIDFHNFSVFDQDGNPVAVTLVDATNDTRVSGNTISDVNPSTFSNGNSASGIFRLEGSFTSLRIVRTVVTPSATDGFVISFAQLLGGRDTDSDGIVDRLDIDSDNDGITDNIEAQTTADYVAPEGEVNAQGLDLAYEVIDLFGLTEANGTLPDGTTYTISGTGLTFDADGVITFGQSGTNETLTITFSAPTDLTILSPQNGSTIWTWEGPSNLDPTLAITNGSNWVYTPGAVDAQLDLSGGNTAFGTRPGGQVEAGDDWGTLQTTGATEITLRAGSFDLYRFTVPISGGGLNAVDTDSDGTADFIDTDSDDEGGNDAAEAGLGNLATGLSDDATDADGDGLFDVFDAQNGTTADDGFDVNESIATGAAALPDIDGDASGGVPLIEDVDFRDAETTDTDGDGVIDFIDVDDDNDGILDVDEGLLSVASLGLSTTESTLSFISTNANIVDPRAEFNNATRIADGNQSNASGLVFNGTLEPGADTVFTLGLNVIAGDVADTFELRASVRALNDLDVRAFDLNIRNTSGSLVFSASIPDTGPTGSLPATVSGFSLSEGFYIVEFIPKSHGAFSATVSRTELIAAEIAELGFVGVTGTGMQIDALSRDTDNDGIDDHLDIDSDNDGIADNIEAQTTLGYLAPNADDAATLRANNGLNSAYVPSNGLNAVDTDSDGTADYIDTDSDDEGGNDTAEAGLTGTATGLSTPANDADGDGLFDIFEAQNGTAADDGFNVNESIATGAFAYLDSDNDAASGTPLIADVDFRDANVVPVASDDGDVTPIAITGNVALDIDVLANDTDADGDVLTITNIFDPVNPTIAIPIAVGQVVELASSTHIELLASGELRVTTTPLGVGLETFAYEISDGDETSQANVRLERSQGSLISVPSNVTGPEDNPIPIPATVDPALLSGGDLPDIVGTAIGFRDATNGTTPNLFTIPPNVTGITITASGGFENSVDRGFEEEFISSVITVDLSSGTFSGHDFVVYGFGQSTNDNFAFADVSLGDAASTGLVAGERAQTRNDFTVDVINGQLSVAATNTLLDIVYLVEFQTSDGSSTNLLDIFGDVQTPTDLISTFDVGTDAELAIVNFQGGRDSTDFRDEDKVNGRLVVDYDTGLVSGSIFSQTGRGENNIVAFAFEGYDLSSGLSILDPNSGATVIGDSAGFSRNVHDFIIAQTGDDLTITRPTVASAPFELLFSVETYDRVDAGSAAFTLGSEAVSFTHIQDPNRLTTFEFPVAQGAETANVTLALSVSGNPSSTNDNENSGTARFIVDFGNGTTSGTFITTRANSPDLVAWTGVPFGTRLFDHPDTQSNHANIADFTDQLSAVLQFDLVTNPDGSVVLQGSAQVESTAAVGTAANYAVVGQAVYSGRLPIEITGFASGGQFNLGSLNAQTGNWEVNAEDIPNLEFIPNEHFSGNTQALVFDYRGDSQTVNVDVVRVADAPTLATTNFTSTENTDIAITNAVLASLVDQDGSETLTVELNNIPVGHTLTDGTNSFTAAAGAQLVDITNWDVSTLVYTAAADAFGDYVIDVRASTTDVDGFTATADSAETLGSFTITVLADTDGDGVSDSVDVDDDNDGILDVVEDGNSTTTQETVVLFSFDENDPANVVDADQGFTANASFGGANAILVHSVTGVNGSGENNGNGRGGNNARFTQIATNAGTTLDPVFLEPDFTQTHGPRTITANGFAEGTFTIDAADGVASFDGNGFIGGFDRLNNPTDINSPNLQTALSADQLAAFELGRFFTFDHLNFSADETGGNNFNTRGVLLTLTGNATTVSTLVQTNLNIAASGAFQTISAQLTGENFGVTDAELSLILDDIQQFSIRAELIGAASSTDVRNTVQFGDDVGEAIDRIERFAVDNIRITSDADGDGIRNSLDIDSDNDGITDNIEAQTTDGYVAPSGVGAGIVDENQDGLDDNYDSRSVNGVLASTATAATIADALIDPVNTDAAGVAGVTYQNDTIPDYLDLDSDGDGIFDNNENGLGQPEIAGGTLSTSANDEDGDGLFDQYETAIDGDSNDGFVVNEGVSDPLLAEANQNSYLPDGRDAVAGSIVPLVADLDYRDAAADDTPPVLDLNGPDNAGTNYQATFVENSAPINIVDTSNMLIADAEGDVVEMVITLTNGLVGDRLNFPSGLPGGVTASVLPSSTLTADGTMTLTFTGGASTKTADWNAVLHSITFEPSTNNVHDPDPADRNITVQVSDSFNQFSNTARSTIGVTPENDPPTLDLDDDNSSGINAGNAQISYTENGTPVPLHSDILTTDLDDSDFETAQVILTNPQAGDELYVNGALVSEGDTGSVGAIIYTVSTNGDGQPVIDFAGVATLSEYATALEAISFANNSEDPSTVQRDITFVVNDGDMDSPVRHAFVDVASVNDAPVIVDPTDPKTPPADPDDIIPAQSGEDGDALTSLDTSVYFDDPDDTVLTYSLDPNAPAWLTIDPMTGIVTGIPPSDASQGSNNGTAGEYDAIIIARDPDGLTAQTTVVYTITNLAPVAQGDGVGTDEDSVLNGDVFADNGNGADADADGDAFVVSQVNGDAANVGSSITGSDGGAFTINPDGSYSFDPADDFQDLAAGETATTSVTYQISDGEGGTDTATVTVTVTGTNDAPEPVIPGEPNPPADPLNYIPVINEADGTAISSPVDLTQYFDDPDTSDTLTLTIDPAELPPGLTFDGTSISGTPEADASQQTNTLGAVAGTYIIPVTVDDGNGGTFITNLTMVIANVPPVAQGDGVGTDEDSVLNGDVFADNGNGADSDADGDAFVVSQVNGDTANIGAPITGSDGGTFTINSDGSYSFDPADDFQDLAAGETATTSVTYQISDGEGGTDTATVTVTVTGTNDAPEPVIPSEQNPPADPQNYIPNQSGIDNAELTPLDISVYFNDPDSSDVLTYTSTDIPSWMSIDPLTGVIAGTSPGSASVGGLNGDGVYTFTIDVSDGDATFSTELTYEIANLPVEAVDDDYMIDEDGELSIPVATGVIDSNDTDGDGDLLTVTAINGVALASGTQITLPSGAFLTLNDDGSFDYDPNHQFEGLAAGDIGTDSFTYQVGDGDGAFDTATVSIEIVGLNDAPIPVDPSQPPFEIGNPPIDPETGEPVPYDPEQLFAPPVDPLNFIPEQSETKLGVPIEDGASVPPFDLTPYFGDPDSGDEVVVSVDPADLPEGLTFDPATNQIVGVLASDASQNTNVSEGEPGTYIIPVTATDASGATFTTNLTYVVTNPAPVVVGEIPDQLSTDGEAHEFSVVPHFEDVDGDDLTYSAEGLPAGLTIDPVTGLISGSIAIGASQDAPNGDRVYPVTVTADDGEGGVISTTFLFEVNPIPFIAPSDAPIVITSNLPVDVVGKTPEQLVVTQAVNEGDPLGIGVALGEGPVVTDAVNGAQSLGYNTALTSDHPVMQAFRSQLATDNALGPQTGPFQGSGMNDFMTTPYTGAELESTFDNGRIDVSMRSLIWQGRVYIDLVSLGSNPEIDWFVSSTSGGELPVWITMIDNNLIQIDRTVETNFVELDVNARGPDGQVNVYSIKVNIRTGEIVLVATQLAGGSGEVAEPVQVVSATPFSDKIETTALAQDNAASALFLT